MMNPPTRFTAAFILLGSMLTWSSHGLAASDERRRQNLETCLSGRYPALCNHSLLSPDELKRALEAERRENLQVCLTGQYPALCRHSLLTPIEAAHVREAEQRVNLDVCLSGRYPALCKRNLLSPEELRRAQEAERAENLKTCLAGRYPSLCKHSWLTSTQAKQVAAAEHEAARQAPRLPPTAPHTHSPRAYSSTASGCEASHWIESVTSDGEIIKLEDGSVWQVDAGDTIDSALWLPTSEIVACEDKLINTDDNESVGARRLK